MKKFLFTTPTVILATLILTACNSGGPTYITAGSAPTAQITVSATGKVSQAPDRASVSAGVVTQAKTADDAMAANAAKMSAAFEQLRAAGIEETDIRTSQMSLNPRFSYQDRKSPKIDGYEVRNTVSATTDNLEKVGPMLDALVKAGVNNINGVSFSISEPETAKTTARDKAIKAAKAKAEAMASAAGVSLGDLTSISENSRGGFTPQTVAFARTASVQSTTPIAAGEQNLSVTVNLTYAIKN
ncbi:MAG: SIMPL domain-containing protein [Maricaulaceae bacterium]